MLKLYVKELLIIRGFKPTAYTLARMGIPYQSGTKIVNNTAKNLSIKLIYKLCMSLNCLPNDLFTLPPDFEKQASKDYKIHELKKPALDRNLAEILRYAPISEVIETTNQLYEIKMLGIQPDKK